MTARAPHAEPYPSMEALRHAYEELLESLPTRSPDQHEESARQIEEFISRTIATGSLLDTFADRREAQGLIDYWVASAFTRPAVHAPQSGTQESAPYYARPDNQLEKFDPDVIRQISERGNAFIEGLSPRQKALARRLLFRLLQFPDSGNSLGSAPAARDELRKFGKSGEVDQLLDNLQEAGVVKSMDEEGKLALSYLSLTRHWGWLTAEIEKRVNFRDLALSWVGSGRSYGALLSLPLTWRFRKYTNLNNWELEFLNKSGRYGYFKVGLGLLSISAIVIFLAYINLQDIYITLYARGRSQSVIDEILSKETSVDRKMDDIRWLANFRQRIELPRVDLGESQLKDFTGILASGATFQSSTLTNVRFNGAVLSSVQFNKSTISQSSFVEAYLYRSSFDEANFCEDVDFSGADLRSASFKRVSFADNTIPIFTNTAWWQAYGWSFDKINLLGKHYPKSQFKGNKWSNFEIGLSRTKIETANRELDGAKSQEEQTRAINGLAQSKNEHAWMLAIYGMVSDGEAELNVREALKLIRRLQQQGKNDDINKGYRRSEANFEDTLAYILMQDEGSPNREAKLTEAVELLKDAIAVRPEGELLFRYAVALNAVGEKPTKFLEDALREEQYEPSHELYLLSAYITGHFKNEIMNLTGRPQQPRPASCAPVNAPQKVR